jgi:hypothetical protein
MTTLEEELLEITKDKYAKMLRNLWLDLSESIIYHDLDPAVDAEEGADALECLVFGGAEEAPKYINSLLYVRELASWKLEHAEATPIETMEALFIDGHYSKALLEGYYIEATSVDREDVFESPFYISRALMDYLEAFELTEELEVCRSLTTTLNRAMETR